MSRRYAAALAALCLAACTSATEKLDDAWLDFERRQQECAERAGAPLPEYTARLRAQGDEDELHRISTPPGSPAARLASITASASW
jgi:hypothetical protein